MSSPSPMETPGSLNWDPAAVDLPQIPVIAPGEDAMSMTIAGVLPTLTAPLSASVAALSAKEATFAGKLGVAESAYRNADDAGSQSVGELGQMLGQVGQIGQQAGAPAQTLSGQAGTFGSMMQQAMPGAQGGGSGEAARTQGGTSSATAQSATGAGSPKAQGDEVARRDQPERDRRSPLESAATGAGPGGTAPALGAPTADPRADDGEELARRM